MQLNCEVSFFFFGTTTTTTTKKKEKGGKKRVHRRGGVGWLVGWFSKRAAPLVKISSGELAKYTERYCASGGRARRVKVLVRLSARVLYMYVYVCMYVRYYDTPTG